MLAIARLREAGVIVTIATGRTPAGTLHVAQNLDLRGPCVCTDGAMIVDMQSGDELLHRTLGATATASVGRAIAAFPHVAATVLVGSTVVLDERGNLLERVAQSWSPVVEHTPRLLDHGCWRSDAGITAAAVIGLSEQIAAVAEQLREHPVSITQFDVPRHDGVSSVIVHPENVSKGSGLAWLANHHGLDVRDTVTVGDWLNDVSMLEAAPVSFAMSHAPQRVQEAAKHVLAASRTGGAIAEIARRVWAL